MRWFRLLPVVLLVLASCGRRPPPPKVRPLWPELYVIEEADRPAAGAFIRYRAPDVKGGGLDIAVADYVDEKGERARVQLIGVVHVADEHYYKQVQKTLDAADQVLYEAIKPADVDIAEWRESLEGSDREMASFQTEIAGWFGFRSQLDAIDYSAKRFVHADMTEAEFRAAGGDALLDDGALTPGAGSEDGLPSPVRGALDSIRAFASYAMSEPNPLRSLARRMMAEVLGTHDIGNALDMFPGLGELILTKRNEVVMDKLAEVLPTAEGTVAIFYGAAHMPDLEERLKKLGYRRAGARWLRAWALRPPLKR